MGLFVAAILLLIFAAAAGLAGFTRMPRPGRPSSPLALVLSGILLAGSLVLLVLGIVMPGS